MADYPSTLPAPLVAGYAVTPLDQTIRSDMEVGAARVRRRTSYRMWTVSLSWFFTDAQMTAFTSWLQDTVDGGAAWWNILLTMGEGGAGSYGCRFVGVPQYQRQAAGPWVVTATVEARLTGD